jgi:hypothetical protein
LILWGLQFLPLAPVPKAQQEVSLTSMKDLWFIKKLAVPKMMVGSEAAHCLVIDFRTQGLSRVR